MTEKEKTSFFSVRGTVFFCQEYGWSIALMENTGAISAGYRINCMKQQTIHKILKCNNFNKNQLHSSNILV